MGKEITHILFARESLDRLSGRAANPLGELLAEYSHSFHFGSIAPDTFFYGISLPLLDRGFCCCGDMVHGSDGNDTSLTPLHMLHELRNGPRGPRFGERLAFTCGFLTHIALDSVMHPYVYYLSGDYNHQSPVERRMARTRHRLIESWIDLVLLRDASMGLEDCPFMGAIRRNGPINLELLRFFFDAFARTGGVDDSFWKYLRRGYTVQMLLNRLFPDAFWGKVTASANRLLNGRLDSFTALFYPWDYRRIPPEITELAFYRHPVTGEEVREDFRGLWARAVARGGEFLLAAGEYLFSHGDLERLAGVVKGYNLSTGLVGVPACRPTHFDHLPIDRLWGQGAPPPHITSLSRTP